MVIFLALKAFFPVFVLIFYCNGRFFAIFFVTLRGHFYVPYGIGG